MLNSWKFFVTKLIFALTSLQSHQRKVFGMWVHSLVKQNSNTYFCVRKKGNSGELQRKVNKSKSVVIQKFIVES